jgi:hypothetical protein
MSKHRGTAGFIAGIAFSMFFYIFLSDVFKSAAVNQYLRGELKCEEIAYRSDKALVCYTVGKD